MQRESKERTKREQREKAILFSICSLTPRLTFYNVTIHKGGGPRGLMCCNIVWTHWVHVGQHLAHANWQTGGAVLSSVPSNGIRQRVHCIIVFCVTRRVNITLSLGLMMMMMTMIMIMMILHMRINELEGQFSVQFELAGVNSSSSIIINNLKKREV